MAALEVRPVGPGDFPLVERLFGPNGASAGCWCMHWRLARRGSDWRADHGAQSRRALAGIVEAGESRAVLALADGEPVGWCDLGPCALYPRIGNKPSLALERPAGAWAVVCFFVTARRRRQGVARALLDAAVRQAAAHGATTLEAYPVETGGTRRPGGVIYTGVPSMYERAGFARLPHAEGQRPIYRLNLAAAE